MTKVRVLIADDSVLYRSQIRAALEGIADVEVAGVASNGRIACDLLEQSNIDFLILDVEMPVMDGLQTLAEMKIRGLTKTKVLLFSSQTSRAAQITLEGLRLGASDFIAKPNGTDHSTSPGEKIRALVEPKLRALGRLPTSQTVPVVPTPTMQTSSASLTAPVVRSIGAQPRVIVIGSSTGGPQVLEALFASLKEAGLKGPLKCPILIVQHMPAFFTAALAERIAKISGLPIQEAKPGPLKNEIYIAPGDYHMVIAGTVMSPKLEINQDEPENFVRPAVDPLFRSAARMFGRDTLGFVLTGMGSDGKLGAEVIRAAGGSIVIQDKDSCAVFGMPGAIFNSGGYDAVMTPKEISALVAQKGAA